MPFVPTVVRRTMWCFRLGLMVSRWARESRFHLIRSISLEIRWIYRISLAQIESDIPNLDNAITTPHGQNNIKRNTIHVAGYDNDIAMYTRCSRIYSTAVGSTASP